MSDQYGRCPATITARRGTLTLFCGRAVHAGRRHYDPDVDAEWQVGTVADDLGGQHQVVSLDVRLTGDVSAYTKRVA